MKRCVVHFVIMLCSFSLAGCAPSNRGPYEPQAEGARDPQRAQVLSLQAADVMPTDPSRAEELLRQALSSDLYYGPAHNNLGVLYLAQGRFYDAAGEFEWAKKLMPGHPDPRINLALTLERAGRTDDALATYESALDVYPDHMAAIQGLVRLHCLKGSRDDRTLGWLNDVALRGETEGWRSWARGQLAAHAR